MVRTTPGWRNSKEIKKKFEYFEHKSQNRIFYLFCLILKMGPRKIVAPQYRLRCEIKKRMAKGLTDTCKWITGFMDTSMARFFVVVDFPRKPPPNIPNHQAIAHRQRVFMLWWWLTINIDADKTEGWNESCKSQRKNKEKMIVWKITFFSLHYRSWKIITHFSPLFWKPVKSALTQWRVRSMAQQRWSGNSQFSKQMHHALEDPRTHYAWWRWHAILCKQQCTAQSATCIKGTAPLHISTNQQQHHQECQHLKNCCMI